MAGSGSSGAYCGWLALAGKIGQFNGVNQPHKPGSVPLTGDPQRAKRLLHIVKLKEEGER